MKRYALIVGIGAYEHLPQLAKPKNDAQAVHDLLKAHGNFDEIHLLQDKRATYAELTQKLEYVLLTQGSSTKAEVLIYFSGHGFTAGASKYEQQGYLATYDCRVAKRSGVVSVESAVSFTLLNGLIADADLSGLAVLLDCCHSEFSIEQALVTQKLSGFSERGFFLSAACRSFESAWENKSDPCSAYTLALLQALKQKEKEEVSAQSAHLEVCKALKGTGQEPIQFGYGDSLVLVDYRWQSAEWRADLLRVSSVVSDENPYQSLNAFTSETAQFFFGRVAEVNLLAQKLSSSNFVPVLGPSGSGKSSVVRAGLVTRLLAQGWQVVTMKPGSEPMARLATALEKYLVEVAATTGARREFLKCLREDGLLAMVQRLFEGAADVGVGSSRVLLIVDQFEEVFTQCSKTIQDAFIGELVAVGRVASPLAVVMTMRSDFVDEWLASGQPPEVIRNDTIWLGALKEENLTAVIVKPARQQGYGLEHGLLSLLLRDVAAEENCLPLLEFALTELWEQRDTTARLLTVNAYEAIGGLTGALNRRADAAYGKLRDIEQTWAKRLCLQLVRIGQEEKDTRQRQPKGVLLNMGGPDNGQHEQTRQIIADVIQDLVDERLLVSALDEGTVVDVGEAETAAESVGNDSRGYVDIAHEALLSEWRLFAQWRQEDRDFRRLEQRLKDAYKEWQEKGEKEAYFLSGGLLLELKEQWCIFKDLFGESWPPGLETFFSESDVREQRDVAALEHALAKAEMQAASRKIRAKLEDTPAQAVEAMLSAVELVGESQLTFECAIYPVQDALYRAFSNVCERIKLEGHRNWVYSVACSPRGDCIVSGSSDNTLRLWDLQGNLMGKPFVGHKDSIYSVAFSPQGDCIVSGSTDNTLRLWDLQGNLMGKPFLGHSGSVRAVAFSPQGDCIVSGSSDNTLRLWDLQGDPIGEPFAGHGSSVRSVAFSPEGNWIISGSYDKTLRLWDLQGNPVGDPFSSHSDSVRAVAFSPQGDRIVSGSGDNTLQLWDLQGNPIGEPFVGHGGAVRAVAFSPQGDRIVSGSDDNILRLWDLAGNPIGGSLAGHSGAILSVTFSSQGDFIVSGSYDKTLRLWDFQGYSIGEPFMGHNGTVFSVAFSPQSDCIVSGSDDKTLRLWDLQGNPIGEPFVGHNGSVLSVAFSPQGDCIVSGSSDSTLHLWDLQGNPIGEPFVGHSDSARAVAFSPQGDCIVSVSSDKTLRLWRGGGWEDWLRHCCTLLLHHTALTLPQTKTARKACEVCEQVWTRQQSAEFLRAQGCALARQGIVEGAVRKFARSQELDKALTFDSAETAQAIAEQRFRGF